MAFYEKSNAVMLIKHSYEREGRPPQNILIVIIQFFFFHSLQSLFYDPHLHQNLLILYWPKLLILFIQNKCFPCLHIFGSLHF